MDQVIIMLEDILFGLITTTNDKKKGIHLNKKR